MPENDIAEGVINIARYCTEHNVDNGTISSLICRSQKHLQHKVNAVNIYDAKWMQWTQC